MTSRESFPSTSVLQQRCRSSTRLHHTRHFLSIVGLKMEFTEHTALNGTRHSTFKVKLEPRTMRNLKSYLHLAITSIQVINIRMTAEIYNNAFLTLMSKKNTWTTYNSLFFTTIKNSTSQNTVMRRSNAPQSSSSSSSISTHP